jgi:hypothetical protein
MSTLPDGYGRGLLDELKEAHSSVRDCLREMEVLTSRKDSNLLELTNARFRISKASLKRRTLFMRACATLRQAGPDCGKTVLESLSRLDGQMRAMSMSHVARWTAEAIASDWRGYCAASGELRADMQKQLRTEEALLFPLLTGQGLERGAA